MSGATLLKLLWKNLEESEDPEDFGLAVLAIISKLPRPEKRKETVDAVQS